jgi:tetratricopeptide (TPR) repeat protein
MEPQIKKITLALNESNFSEALATAREMEKAYPEDAGLKSLFGDIFFRMSNFTMAYEKYEEAMKLDPCNEATLVKLGAVSIEMDNLSGSANHFKAALGIEPDNPHYQGNYGWALWHLGKKKEDESLMEMGYEYLCSARNAGVDMDMVKDALAEFHLWNSKSTWPIVTDEQGSFPCATHLEHVQEARAELRKAAELISSSNKMLKKEYEDSTSQIKELEKRQFHGYPFVIKAAVIAAVFFFLFGAVVMSMTLLAMAGMYYHAHLMPGYLANRKLVKGKFGDPFWVRRINAVGELAGRITIWGSSLTGVLFQGWLIGMAARVLQYTMAIFIMPFLILAGYVSSYDLLNRAKKLAVKK